MTLEVKEKEEILALEVNEKEETLALKVSEKEPFLSLIRSAEKEFMMMKRYILDRTHLLFWVLLWIIPWTPQIQAFWLNLWEMKFFMIVSGLHCLSRKRIGENRSILL